MLVITLDDIIDVAVAVISLAMAVIVGIYIFVGTRKERKGRK